MFDITGKDIADLNDTDLRKLVARLCEAELWRNGLPVSGVTAGGDQNAADGGLDVRVELEAGSKTTDFIPRPKTGFQVKVPDMPRAEILKEMRPNGSIRPVIQELACNSGAYVIVSSSGSTADRALQNRKKAMREAVDGIRNAADLVLDFYDRDRLASWVRLYPGIVSWVRERLGKPLQGWQPFGNWSAPMEPTEAEYLLDRRCRLYDARTPREGSVAIEEGIGRIRDILSRPTGTVRLVGLSGVGKTRLVQALFDQRVGVNHLNPSEVIYTDLADDPTPSPRDLIARLVQSRQRAIVIVDNCPPKAHRALTTACVVRDSSVSLLTVEYDVGDDEPEWTEVFRLEAASDDIIEQLVERREPHISQVDRQRIAGLSGGNARIALALARTVRHGESVAALSDLDLFKRLFHQRHPEDTSLLRAAEACSLVYSFDGETGDGGDAELPILAELSGLSIDELYRHIRKLKDRDLLQQRSKWRAVLPHALANKLARHALDSLMPDRITEIMIKGAPDRLRKSFSRRLGYLHDCETAQNVVNAWLSEGGLLADIGTLGPIELAMFHNVAPVAPEAALDVLERSLQGSTASLVMDLENRERYKIASLLRSLAYEAASFRRACMLLANFAMAEPPGYNYNATSGLFKELFHLHLSGTHASAQQRLQVIETLLSSGDSLSQECGLTALNEMLETWHFSSTHDFEFGARPRDFGWQPRTIGEVSDWFHEAIGFALNMIATNSPVAERLSSILAANFRGLWVNGNVYDDLETVVSAMTARGFWPEGWISVRATLRFDADKMSDDILRRLRVLEEILRPSQLLDEARAFVSSKPTSAFDIADGEEDDQAEEIGSGYQRVVERTEAIGRAVAIDPGVLSALLPELSSGQDGGRRWAFGMGLADGATDLNAMWKTLVAGIASTPENDRNIQVLRGFLSRAASLVPEKIVAFLDDAVFDPVLGPWLPILQCSTDIDEKGINRLLAAIEHGLAPAWTYGHLSLGRATDPIPSPDLRRLLTSISLLPNGSEVAVDILYMKLYSTRKDGVAIDDDLIQCGRTLLLQYPFAKSGQRIDHKLADIVEACLTGTEAAECAEAICKRLAEAFSTYSASAYDYGSLLKSLFQVQPIAALTILLAGSRNSISRWLMRDVRSGRKHPLDEVPLEILIGWANDDASDRFPALASVIRLFVGGDEEGSEAISPNALGLLDAAPDKEAILSCYKSRLHPSCWSGSLADILERRRTAIQRLMSYSIPIVADWAEKWERKLAEWIKDERARDRSEDQAFE
ncbi:hypothetical protein [Methylocaldum marinum]|uniref:hypothetical protein n=1 Tax=Methylocaldum marinum TaxID=1432792 RepID=UPI0011AEA356|nr:hypothetical protein [Methylocaldum marinum]